MTKAKQARLRAGAAVQEAMGTKGWTVQTLAVESAISTGEIEALIKGRWWVGPMTKMFVEAFLDWPHGRIDEIIAQAMREPTGPRRVMRG